MAPEDDDDPKAFRNPSGTGLGTIRRFCWDRAASVTRHGLKLLAINLNASRGVSYFSVPPRRNRRKKYFVEPKPNVEGR